jgi:hypothetical protein
MNRAANNQGRSVVPEWEGKTKASGAARVPRGFVCSRLISEAVEIRSGVSTNCVKRERPLNRERLSLTTMFWEATHSCRTHLNRVSETLEFGLRSSVCPHGDGADNDGTVFSLSTGLGPFVAFVRNAGRVGQTAEILGQGFAGTTGVSFNGGPATFTVRRDTFLTATVPAGAITGYVTVTTPSGALSSNVQFQVLQ